MPSTELARYIPEPSAKTIARATADAVAIFKTDTDRQLEAFATELRFEMAGVKTGFIRMGEVLLSAKAIIGHGRFWDWFDDLALDFSRRTAANMIQVAQSDLVNSPAFALLPSTALTVMADPKTPPAALAAVERLIKRRGGPENVRAGEVVELVKSFQHDEKVAIAQIEARRPKKLKRREIEMDDGTLIPLTDDGKRILPDLSDWQSRPETWPEAIAEHLEGLEMFAQLAETNGIDLRKILRASNRSLSAGARKIAEIAAKSLPAPKS